jgi:hypothetical protein
MRFAVVVTANVPKDVYEAIRRSSDAEFGGL